MSNTTQLYREWYHEYQDKYSKSSYVLAGMTGYIGAIAKYCDNIPTKERIRILQYLIETWRKYEPSEMTERWCVEWEEKIKELSVEEFGLLKK